jgi:hypothetical protein
MKYAVEIGPDALIYLTKFYKDWFRHSEINKGVIHRHTDSMEIA